MPTRSRRSAPVAVAALVTSRLRAGGVRVALVCGWLAICASCKDPVTAEPPRDGADAQVVTLAPRPSAPELAVEPRPVPADAAADHDATPADAAPPPPPPLVVRNEPTKLASGQTIAGPCVTPSVAAAAKSAKAGGPDDADFFSPSSHELDVDGDGAPDYVLNGGASRTIMTLLVYLKRGSCGYDLGAIDAEGAPEILPSKSFGLFDLRVGQDLCQPKTRTNRCTVIYKFDGRRYRPTSYAPSNRGGLF